MKLKKHHVVLATLVVALSAAVYLNWQLSGGNTSNTVDTSKELGVATYVNSNISSEDEAALKTKNANLSKEQSEYFAEARAEREVAQEEAVSLAKAALENTENSDEAYEDATEQLSKLEDMILSQNRVEATLKAKGFSDCMCYLSETSCTVIVPKNEMNDSSALIIKDCIKENSGLPFENISIVEV